MHALGDVLTKAIWSGYYPTLNPYLFLRDLLGAMVLAGVGLAIYRRSRPGHWGAPPARWTSWPWCWWG